MIRILLLFWFSSTAMGAEARLVYLWSKRMPFSRSGIDEINAAASALGVSVAFVEERPGTLHYPTVILYKGDMQWGPEIPGYKGRGVYRRLLSRRIALDVPPPLPPSPNITETAKVKLIAKTDAGSKISLFFKPVPGTDWIAFEDGGANHLFHMATKERVPAPGNVDPTPTPDGELLTTPGFLTFYRFPSLEKVGEDGEMTDSYQSIGLLSRGHYRVLTGFRQSIAVRDYVWDGKSVRPSGKMLPLCDRHDLSLPMISMHGRELAARDNRTGTQKLFRIDPATGACDETLDVGFPTGKMAFSFDGGWLAAAVMHKGRTDAAIYDRASKRWAWLTTGKEGEVHFPAFLRNGELLYLKTPGAFTRISVSSLASPDR